MAKKANPPKDQLINQLSKLVKLPAIKMPNTVDLLHAFDFIGESRKLELYPPFFFMGIKVTHLHSEYRQLSVRLPLRWSSKNHHGTMFGGFIAALADPLPALLCARIFPGTDVWTKKCSVQFLRPGRTDLEVRVEVTEEHVQSIGAELSRSGASAPRFHYYFYDSRDRKIARVTNIVAMKMRRNSATDTESHGEV
jgi:uncharacterized protein (TIGR00369 family)